MKRLNAEEILSIISTSYDVYNFAYGEWFEANDETPASEIIDKLEKQGLDYSQMTSDLLEELGLGKVVEVSQYGGEGQGDRWYSIKHFVDHDVYIKTTGHYSSYNGTDFYDGYGHEVRPMEKTITVYE